MTTHTSNTKYKKRNLRLNKFAVDLLKSADSPEERDAYVRKLRSVGWTYSSIAEGLGVSRERIRQICAVEDNDFHDDGQLTPRPPQFPVKEPRQFVEPKPETLARLLELQPKAQQVRANAPRYREEAEEYTALLNKAHVEEGVTLYRLGKRLGVTHSALRFRLARYGYKAPAAGATSKSYKPVIIANRAI